MPRPTNEQMFEWANNPPEWQYLGYAQSQEELEDLHDMSVEARRAFLLKAAQREMARRAFGAVAEGEIDGPNIEAKFDFTTLPIRRTITLNDCESLTAIHQYHRVMRGERPSWDSKDAKRLWREAANTYGHMNGYDITAHKFSDGLFKPWNPQYRGSDEDLARIAEENYQLVLDSTTRNERKGYALRFLMDGVFRLEDACLDVESLEGMIQKQRRRSSSTRYFYDYRLGFWQDMIRAKREFDRKGPNRMKQTYADVVDELAPGVYSAPYIDRALVVSGQFISIDDWRRASLAVDNDRDTSRLVKGFNLSLSLVAKGDRWGDNRRYYSQQDPLNAHGAIFFDRALLSKAHTILQHERAGKFIVPMLEYLMGESGNLMGDELDPDYQQIVFGMQAVSDEVAEVIRNK